MTVVKMFGDTYKIPEDLSEIMLGDFVTCQDKVEPKMPEKMREILLESEPEKRKELMASITDVEYSHDFVPYYARYVECFTKMPYDDLMGRSIRSQEHRLDWQQLEGIYWKIHNLFNTFDYEKVKDNEITFENEKWFLPKHFMDGSTVIEFMEAAQFQQQNKELQNGNWLALPKLIAVLLRKKDEVYDSNLIDMRSNRFKENLGMDVALRVAFFLIKRSEPSVKDSVIYMINQHLNRSGQVSVD